MYIDLNFLSKTSGQSKTERLYKIFEAIIDSSHDGIWVCDGAGTVVALNQASANFMGVPPEKLLGKNMRQIVQEAFLSQSVTLEALEKRRMITKYNMMPRTGKLLLVTAKPIFDQQGDIELIIVNDRDITTTMETQLALQKSQENLQRLQDELRLLTSLKEHQEDLICESPKFMHVVRTAFMLAALDESNILLLGESGTGKGKLARLIHQHSPRASKEFVHINCAAIPESLLEAELFGYEKGAFTGASHRGKIGLIEVADKGTLFLDEIGELPHHVQSKILTYLDTHQITRIGGTASIDVNCKIIAATNRNIEEMVAKERFRKDLYYRLSAFSIEVPPLRERLEDLFELANHFLKKYNKSYKKECRIGPYGYAKLSRYSFPGNIRELENIIKRGVAFSENDIIDDMIARYIDINDDSSDNIKTIYDNVPQYDLRHLTIIFERMIISDAMEHCNNTRELAKKLNVSQATILRKMRRAGIDSNAFTNAD